MTGQRSSRVLGRRSLLTAAVAIMASAVAACSPGTAEPERRSTAPSTPQRGAGAGTVGLGIVGILTADMDRSLRFYRHLGLDIPESAGGDSYRLRSPDDHVLFWETAATVRTFDPSWELPPPTPRRVVLEFGFTSPEHLDATYRSLIDAGAPSHLDPFDQGGGIRYAMVEDPDGNQISLRFPAT